MNHLVNSCIYLANFFFAVSFSVEKFWISNIPKHSYNFLFAFFSFELFLLFKPHFKHCINRGKLNQVIILTETPDLIVYLFFIYIIIIPTRQLYIDGCHFMVRVKDITKNKLLTENFCRTHVCTHSYDYICISCFSYCFYKHRLYLFFFLFFLFYFFIL